MHGWSAPQPGWAADPGPLGTGLGLRELGFKLRRGKTRLIRPPKELRGRQVESCEFLSLSIPRPGGPGTSTAAPPLEPLPRPPAGRPHTRLGVSPPRPRNKRRPLHEGVEPQGWVGSGGRRNGGGRRGPAQTVTCRRAWSSCGAEDRLSTSILVSSLQSSVSSN